MSYMTKDQLENYLSGLPASKKASPAFNNARSELVYPMQKLSVQSNEQDIDQETYGSIQDRMRRLRTATGTVMDATHAMTPAFPETPKPVIASKPSFSSQKADAFEASLSPRRFEKRAPPPPVQPKPKATISSSSLSSQSSQSQSQSQSRPPPPPPPMPSSSTPSTPPPAVPNSPRPPKPTEERVRTLNPIYAGLDCPQCHKSIEGSVVSAMGQIWHAHCFVCSTCHKPLENEQFFEKDGKAYCKKDYQNFFSLHCDYCHEPIEQQAISALGKHYHEGHFCCTVCKEPFGDHSAFMVHEDKPYCQQDYMKMCGKKCGACEQYISGEYVNALGQDWHKACFVCTDCKRPFSGGSFLVRDNKPYCEEHYHHPRQAPPPPVSSSPSFTSPSLPTIPQVQHEEGHRKPPALKPKPALAKKPTLNDSSAPSTPKTTEPPNFSSSSSTSKVVTESKPAGGKVCHQCNQAIDGPSSSALGHDYHIHHFQCSACNRALSSRVPGMWQGDKHGELICKMCAFKQSQA